MLDINVVQVDHTSFTKKRKLNTSACARCHERKVKCDASTSRGPCRNCLTAGETCRTHLDGRARNTTKATGVVRPQPLSAPVEEIFIQDHDEPAQTCHTGIANLALTASSSGPDSACNLSMPETNTFPSFSASVPSLSPSHESEPFGPGTSSSGVTRTNSSLGDLATAASNCRLSPPPVSHDTDGMIPAPSLPLDRFEAYVEDTLGSYAPSFGNQQHTSRYPENTSVQANPTDHPTSWQGPTWPEFRDSPNHLRPLDVNMSSRSTLALEHQVTQMDSADMEYLRAKGAFDLPARSLQEDLVAAYFADVHPTAPVIHKAEFLSSFHGNGSPSRLLLFAIFTSGSRACRNPALLDRNGTNQGSAQKFYKATKALLDTGYEQNRLVRVQALLLLTWWWDKKDDGGRNMRSCAVDAINTAQSLGMHRWDHYPKDNIILARIWKRVWWTCFNRDVAVAVSHGLPCILSLSDFDVHPLMLEDFDEQPDVPVNLRRWPYKPIEIAFSIEVIKVAETLHHIHTAHFVTLRLQTSLTKSIEGRESYLAALAQGAQRPPPPGAKTVRVGFPDDYNDHSIYLCRQWLDRLPDTVKYDVDDIQGHDFWPAFLHVLYLTNVMLRFREKAVSRPAKGRADAERLYCQARGIAAATLISKILRNVRAHNEVLRFTGQLTISLFNCLIFFLIEGQSSKAETRRDAQSKYSQCLHMLYDFSQLWVSASLVHRLFEALQAHMQLQPPATALSLETSSSTLSSMNQWHPLLPGLRLSSDITIPYLKDLLEHEFYYDGSSVTGPSLVRSSDSLDTGFSSPAGIGNHFFLDDMSQPSPDLSLPLGSDMPDSLDVAQWINFFGLSDETVTDVNLGMCGQKDIQM